MTAIDYLVKELPTIYWEDAYYSDLFEKAKEMEKQQIIDSYKIAYIDGYNDNSKDGKQYYNKTFKNK